MAFTIAITPVAMILLEASSMFQYEQAYVVVVQSII
jgi:hypothetical protein